MAIQEAGAIAPFRYIIKSEEGAANPAVFQLRPLKEIEWYDVELYQDTRGELRSSSRSVRQVLIYALIDWEGVLNDKGEAIAFNRIDRSANIDRLPFGVLSELYGAVLDRSRVTEAQKKT